MMAREPLLLLPPEGADARYWAPVAATLGLERMVAIAPVHNGDRVEEIASEIVTSAPPRFALCGAGLGGMVAMEILRRAPERVTRLALIDTSPLAEMPDEAADRETRIIKAKTGQMPQVFEADLRRAGLSPGPATAQTLKLALDMGLQLGTEAYLRQMRCLMRRKDQQTTLRKTKCPAVVICGAGNQRYSVKRHLSMSELLPYAELCVIEEAGNLTALEKPQETIEVLEKWLVRR